MQDLLTDEAFGWQEYHGQTTLHPLALGLLALLGVLVLLLPRRHLLSPYLVLICLIPSAQRVVLLSLDFSFLRILVLLGACRVLFRGEWQRCRWQPPDTILLAWAAVTSAAYVLLWGSSSAFVYMAGQMTEGLGVYLVVRCAVRNWSDVRNFAVAVAVVGAVVSVGFLNEKATGRNAFAVFGGVPEITVVRDDRLRCQGAFSHAILAGCFWAALLPYVVALWWSRKALYRAFAAVGVTAAILIIFTCASSTPVSSLIAGIAAAVWFKFRAHSKSLRIAVVSCLVVLHLAMNHPVWHLIARVDLAGGSTGYHRYLLIDMTIQRVFEWGAIGIKDTENWGLGLQDVTNQYVYAAVRGGLLGLILFLTMIKMSFSRVGSLWRAAGQNREQLAMAWALGVSLFVHCVSFIGVSYFGQIVFTWYFSLAVVVSLHERLLGQAENRPRELAC